MSPRAVPELIGAIHASHASACRQQRELFRLIAEISRHEDWEPDYGAHDLAHFVAMHCDISYWKASRWVHAAVALESLPRLSSALERGDLGVDKVVELARFATAETEEGLIAWAWGASTAAIRRRGDIEVRREREDAAQADRERRLTSGFCDDGRRWFLSADLPAAEGAIVDRALDLLAVTVSVMPGEDPVLDEEARRADALVVLSSASLAEDPDPDRATVVVHAELDALVAADRGCELEAGGVIHAETARRLLCHGRVQVVAEELGRPVGLGRTSRVPSAAMVRQLRYRDRECTFAGCGARRFLQAHHVTWWSLGGRTDLDDMVLVCFFHHKLVHEYGWSIRRDPDGAVRWFDPDGVRYGSQPRAGPVAV